MPLPSQPCATLHSLEYLRKTNTLNLGDHKKVLIANRGEIAIRLIRSAHELGLLTVGIFSYEDRLGMHRYKADESYQIGEQGQFTPVGAYLAQDEIITIAKNHGATMIHPGYGFLSENAEFARKVIAAGIAFVGPDPEVIEKLGDKTAARQIAMECGVPVVPGTPGPISSLGEIRTFVSEHGFPIIIKAAMGGGGRGMRVVWKEDELENAFIRAQSEAAAAFGDGTVFVERFLHKPKHIEVQLLADSTGEVIHMYDRDCSVQRRHQKVIEVAPSIDLQNDIREAMLADAVKLARYVGYRNAGTAEFLVDQHGRHYFIEINPRIQVEHTVTEEVTGLDIVSMQMQIAAGITFKDLELTQDDIATRGCAIQCRITTEDPALNFQPDTGRIEVYRSAGGNGVRLDGGPGFAGSIITPYYDSLLVKVTCYGDTYEKARRRMLSALLEFRIRGVKTNTSFLQNLLTHPTFRSGKCWTTFIDDAPELFHLIKSKNRAEKLLTYLGDVIVNGCRIKGQVRESKALGQIEIPHLEREGKPLNVASQPYPKGWRQVLLDQGPEAFAKAVRRHPGVLIMDTTWRDAHQSLLATRLRTVDMANIAPTTAHALANAFSLEMWGGATFDVSMRFLYEDPWERLDRLRELVPNIPFQMLLRGANAVGYTSYPDNVIYDFCVKARKHGIDVFRVFDSLNYIENMKLGIDAVRAAGGVVEGTLCYTGDVSDPTRTKHTLEYYVNFVQELVDAGIHILGIKDMAGLLKPKASRMLVGAIRQRFPDLPIHVHTHDTAGTGVASMLACADAGADIIDVAIDSMSGVTSQPSMGAIVSALQGTQQDTGIAYKDIMTLNDYWEQVRLMYNCFDPDVKSSDAGVYQHEMPGGQYTNLMFQAHSLGLGSQWKQVREAYIAANKLCGDIVKVTPSSKVVGDLAQFLVSNNLTAEEVLTNARSLSFPTSVVEYFQGYLGQPYGGFPEPLRSHIIKDLPRIEGRPGASLDPVDFEKLREDLVKTYGPNIRDVDLSSAALYPKVFADYRKVLDKYGNLAVLPTQYFLTPLTLNEECPIQLEPGKLIIVKYVACGPLNPTSGMRDVYFELNGEVRVISVKDDSTSTIHEVRPKADPSRPGDIGAPMAGVVVEVRVKPDAVVKEGDPLCVLSAMKMETVVSAPVAGTVEQLLIKEGDSLSAGDLVARIVH